MGFKQNSGGKPGLWVPKAALASAGCAVLCIALALLAPGVN